MSKFQKKPIIIEAIQFTNKNCKELLDWINAPQPSNNPNEVLAPINNAYSIADSREFLSRIIIRTLEGEMTATVGDYIIKGVQGEFYPCKADIFAATYDKV